MMIFRLGKKALDIPVLDGSSSHKSKRLTGSAHAIFLSMFNPIRELNSFQIDIIPVWLISKTPKQLIKFPHKRFIPTCGITHALCPIGQAPCPQQNLSSHPLTEVLDTDPDMQAVPRPRLA